MKQAGIIGGKQNEHNEEPLNANLAVSLRAIFVVAFLIELAAFCLLLMSKLPFIHDWEPKGLFVYLAAILEWLEFISFPALFVLLGIIAAINRYIRISEIKGLYPPPVTTTYQVSLPSNRQVPPV